MIGSPEQAGEPGGDLDNLELRRTDGSQLPENEAEERAGGRDDHIVDGGRENAPPQGRTLQRDINTRTFLHIRLLSRLNRDSAKSRRRRDHFRRFQDARTVRYRLGQLVERSRRRRPGARELNDLCCGWRCGWRYGRSRRPRRFGRQGRRRGCRNFNRMSGAVGESIQGQSLVRNCRYSLLKSRGLDGNATCGAMMILLVEA